MTDKPTQLDLTQSMEDYLKTIFRIENKRGVVRVKEISNAMNVTYPSTSGIIKKMEGLGLVEHERYGYVKLTGLGAQTAKKMQKREQVIADFLNGALNIPKAQALKDACKMEHAMSDLTADQLLRFFEFINHPSKEVELILKAFTSKAAEHTEE